MTVTASPPPTETAPVAVVVVQEPQHTPEMLLTVLKDASARAGTALADRDQTVVKVRDAGATWRDIAQAVGMTEHGVAKLYARTKVEVPA